MFDKEYIGIIEMVDKELTNGRCKIRVFGVYGHFHDVATKISVSNLPWAYPRLTAQFSSKDGSGCFSMPKEGSRVRVVFDNGDHNHPRYSIMEDLDPEVIQAASESPDAFHSIFWDSDNNIKMYYSEGSGFMLDFKDSIINIQPNGTILIDHSGSSSTIELQNNTCTIVTNGDINQSAVNNITANSRRVHINGEKTYVGHDPVYKAPLGEFVVKAFTLLAAAIDKKYPTTPGVIAGKMQELSAKMLSDTVKVSR
jgi:hypothetical protein